jgi:DNA polymerase
MTGEQKTAVASFLDLAADYLAGGYSRPREAYRFDDDREAAPDAAGGTGALSAGGGAAGGEAGEDSLENIASHIRACRGCGLCNTRTNAVPGEGAAAPLVLVVGEGPGAEEDAGGRPFVGRAGQLLDRMLNSIGLSRERNCFIANVVKCRPPENRDPLPAEAEACAPFLARQIRVLKPRLILCLGKVAANRLLEVCYASRVKAQKTADPAVFDPANSEGGPDDRGFTGEAETNMNDGPPGFREPEAIGRLRGRFYDYPVSPDLSIPLLATYHPSALLRNEDLKRPAWEDLKKLRAFLAEPGGI